MPVQRPSSSLGVIYRASPFESTMQGRASMGLIELLRSSGSVGRNGCARGQATELAEAEASEATAGVLSTDHRHNHVERKEPVTS
jgi:hypothetical protein